MKAAYKINAKCVLIRDVNIWGKIYKPGHVVTLLDAYHEKNMIILGFKTKKGIYEAGFGPIPYAMKTRKNLIEHIFQSIVHLYYPSCDRIFIYKDQGGQMTERVINVMHESDEYPQHEPHLNQTP